ncbi:MAG: protoporphyrinogen oxidase [Candidatus Rokubacteria bacterium 13_1_40CM_4_69_39]|nr:MAG: protoporphyrinogen oxidase [Candidatus Rokubacteria bacterium 13_1_40CM_4_69_39]OLD25224.1 MAG: protoporphyrinogen oxidase [Candidatus Rokubacteria bacterium 13_1_40CM_2_70_45]OLE45874.1 MAG: protoporphyrinogen oxidase [Candidatus Rokubacteria bacterium 13_1_20CM_2_69_58]PYM50209.1 MAG: protoporphyrinogen oxidase [Candidatus Rokubacteria bacterium]
MRLVVVGGGITGLAAAHHALELARERRIALELTLVEARERLGGTIATERAGGFLIEAGPDSFLSEKPWALALCRRLGLEDRLARTDDRYRKVFVWHAGRLHPLPDGWELLAPTRLAPFLSSRLFSWPGTLRMAFDLVLPRGIADDESLGAFVRRRLGREALERVAQPLVAGIYTADPDDLSLTATMPRFAELEKQERSIILGLRRARRRALETGVSGARWSLFVTLKEGMEDLVAALATRLQPGTVLLKQRVAGVERRGDRWRVATAEGADLDADRVIVATESHAAARMLRYVDPTLATLLAEIPYASSATVTLGYRRADVPHPLDGFGFVVPRTEKRALLACTFSSVKYAGRAPEGDVLLRAFVGGALNEAVLELDDAPLVMRARAELREALGITAAPALARVFRWPKAMPQYHVGHLARVETIERRAGALPGLDLAGGAYRGVGIADCVRSGEAAAERALGAGAV